MIDTVLLCGPSRSGTTLVATVLDAHPRISMGYELLPGRLPDLRELAALVRRAWEEGGQRPRTAGNLLKAWGHPDAGVFLKRCARTLVDAPELAELLETFPARDPAALSPDDKLRLAAAVAERKRRTESAAMSGFKAGRPRPRAMRRLFPNGIILSVIRDPRDVFASIVASDFPGTAESIAREWTAMASARAPLLPPPGLPVVPVRYEDLVLEPEPAVRRLCDALGLPFDEAMLNFADSKASVFREGQRHVNAEALERGFFDSSVGRWREDVQPADVSVIERICGRTMRRWGYLPASSAPGGTPSQTRRLHSPLPGQQAS